MTKVVSKSSVSGVVWVACDVVLSRVADGRIRLRLMEGRIELERALTVRELRNAGRLAPRADVGLILGGRDDFDGRMLDDDWELARTLVGLTKDRRELLPPNDPLDDALGLKADTDPLDLRGPENPGRRLEASAVFTAVALIVGVISVGVMMAAPLVELFLFGLKDGRDLELPNGRMTGVKPFFLPGNFPFESSSSSSSPSLTVSLIDPSSTGAVGFISCDVEMTFPIAAVGSMFTLLSTAEASICFAAMMLEVLSMTCA